MRRHALLLVALMLTMPSRRAAAQSPNCDPELARRGRGTFGYQARGTRCEGIYTRNVTGGSMLYVVSLTEGFDFDPRSTAPLLVTWSGVTGDTLRLRAEGVKPELYYRMDAERPLAAASFEWPVEVLANQSIRRRDIGVVGMTRRALGGMERVVLVPLRINQRGRAVSCGPLQLRLWAGVRFDEVRLSVAPLLPNGNPGRWITENEELGEGFYPQEQPIDVPLPPLEPGTYYVRFVAARRGAPIPALVTYVHRPPPAADCPR